MTLSANRLRCLRPHGFEACPDQHAHGLGFGFAAMLKAKILNLRNEIARETDQLANSGIGVDCHITHITPMTLTFNVIRDYHPKRCYHRITLEAST